MSQLSGIKRSIKDDKENTIGVIQKHCPYLFVGSVECYAIQILYERRLEFHILRSQMHVFSFTDGHLPIVQCLVASLPLPSGSSTTAERQLYHRPVVDEKVFIEKRNNLDLSVIMTRFGALRSQLTHSSVLKGKILPMQREGFACPEVE